MDFHIAREAWTPTDFSCIPQRDRLTAGRGREQIRAQIRECEAEIARCAQQLRELRLALNRSRDGGGEREALPESVRSQSVRSQSVRSQR